jgi:hypothetical protein
MDFCIRWFELLQFGNCSALDTCSYRLLHSMIRTAPFRWLFSTGHVLIWTFAFDDSNCSFRWLLSTGHVLIRTFAFADSNCSMSVTTQHLTRAHMDFCIRWFELLHFGDYSALDTYSYGLLHSINRTAHFGDYSALDTCSFGILHSLIRTAPFRW